MTQKLNQVLQKKILKNGTKESDKKSEIIAKQKYILSITENGFGKRTSFYDYRVTNRGGKGIIGINTSSRNTIYSFGIVEPYIFNRDVDLIYDISFANYDRSSGYSYNLDEFSTNFGFKYALAENTSHRIILQYVFVSLH